MYIKEIYNTLKIGYNYWLLSSSPWKSLKLWKATLTQNVHAFQIDESESVYLGSKKPLGSDPDPHPERDEKMLQAKG